MICCTVVDNEVVILQNTGRCPRKFPKFLNPV